MSMDSYKPNMAQSPTTTQLRRRMAIPIPTQKETQPETIRTNSTPQPALRKRNSENARLTHSNSHEPHEPPNSLRMQQSPKISATHPSRMRRAAHKVRLDHTPEKPPRTPNEKRHNKRRHSTKEPAHIHGHTGLTRSKTQNSKGRGCIRSRIRTRGRHIMTEKRLGKETTA